MNSITAPILVVTNHITAPVAAAADAYQLAVREGFTGTRSEWLLSLQADNSAVLDALETLTESVSGMDSALADRALLSGGNQFFGAQVFAESVVIKHGSSEVLRVADGAVTVTGTITAATALPGTSSTQLATTAFTQAAIAGLVNAAPATLDTLAELAAALGNDANFAAGVTSGIAGKLAKASNLEDLADAATARRNLGLVIGTDVLSPAALALKADEMTPFVLQLPPVGATEFLGYSVALMAYTGSTQPFRFQTAIFSMAYDLELMETAGLGEDGLGVMFTAILGTDEAGNVVSTLEELTTLLNNHVSPYGIELEAWVNGNAYTSEIAPDTAAIDIYPATIPLAVGHLAIEYSEVTGKQTVYQAASIAPITWVRISSLNGTLDANKPVSGPQQTALNLKADRESPVFAGNINLTAGTILTYGAGVASAHRTALGLGTTDNVTFNSLTIGPTLNFANTANPTLSIRASGTELIRGFSSLYGTQPLMVLAAGGLSLGSNQTAPRIYTASASVLGLGTYGSNTPSCGLLAASVTASRGTTGVGTVTITAGALTTVTGTSTDFLSRFIVGDSITVTTTSGSQTRVISAIASDTSMTTAAFTGTATGVAYTHTASSGIINPSGAIACTNLTASGLITAAGIISTGGSTLGTGSSVLFTSRSRIKSAADGEISFRNNADNANSNITAGNVTASGAITGDSLALTTPLPITSGGTGGATESAARTSLKVPASDPTGIAGASALGNFVSLSQASYDALAVKDAATLYVIA